MTTHRFAAAWPLSPMRQASSTCAPALMTCCWRVPDLHEVHLYSLLAPCLIHPCLGSNLHLQLSVQHLEGRSSTNSGRLVNSREPPPHFFLLFLYTTFPLYFPPCQDASWAAAASLAVGRASLLQPLRPPLDPPVPLRPPRAPSPSPRVRPRRPSVGACPASARTWEPASASASRPRGRPQTPPS